MTKVVLPLIWSTHGTPLKASCAENVMSMCCSGFVDALGAKNSTYVQSKVGDGNLEISTKKYEATPMLTDELSNKTFCQCSGTMLKDSNDAGPRMDFKHLAEGRINFQGTNMSMYGIETTCDSEELNIRNAVFHFGHENMYSPCERDVEKICKAMRDKEVKEHLHGRTIRTIEKYNWRGKTTITPDYRKKWSL